MFNEYTTIQQMQAYLWDFYKQIHNRRPRHWTDAQWNSREFLQQQCDALIAIEDQEEEEEKQIEEEKQEETWWEDNE